MNQTLTDYKMSTILIFADNQVSQ